MQVESPNSIYANCGSTCAARDAIHGMQNFADEPSLPGITATLYQGSTCTGSPVAPVQNTGASGNYLFSPLPADIYSVGFGNIPPGWFISPANQGGDDAVDSDPNAQACIEGVTLGPDNLNQDMGVYATGSAGSQLWCESDANVNNEYNPEDGDFGLPGITVQLFADDDCDGVANAGASPVVQLTNAEGLYLFDGLSIRLDTDPLSPMCYVVAVSPDDPALQSCNSPITPITQPMSLDTSSPVADDVDFGFIEAPTAIALSHFQILGGVERISLVWSTTMEEEETLGFHIHRGATANFDDGVRISEQMIPGQGANGGDYRYVDAQIVPYEPYFYWLVEVTQNGDGQRYGPVSATAVKASANGVIYLPLVSGR